MKKRKSRTDQSISYMTISPALAKTWLAERSNPLNASRTHPRTINKYADDMRTGRWKSKSGDAIQISTEGLLLNGHHRLAAVVESDQSIQFAVAFNVPPDHFEVLDQGKPRSPAFVLQIDSKLASVSRLLVDMVGAEPTTARVGAVAEEVAEMFKRVYPRKVTTRRLNSAPIIAGVLLRAMEAQYLGDDAALEHIVTQYGLFVKQKAGVCPIVAHLSRLLLGPQGRVREGTSSDGKSVPYWHFKLARSFKAFEYRGRNSKVVRLDDDGRQQIAEARSIATSLIQELADAAGVEDDDDDDDDVHEAEIAPAPRQGRLRIGASS